MKTAWILLALAGAAFGQTLIIDDVITTGPRDHNFAPGTTVYLLGTFPQGAGRDFSITVGGVTGGINVADNEVFITAMIPLNAPSGPTTITASYEGQTSNAFPLTIQPLAPEFDGAGVLISGSTALPQYEPYNPFADANSSQRISSTFAASPGEVLSVNVYGLAADTPPGVEPSVTVGGVAAKLEAYETFNSGGGATFYFAVPSSAPLGEDPVVFTFNGVATNTVNLPVGAGPAIANVLNGASFATSNLVSPGSIVSVFGSNFGAQDNLSAFPQTTVNGDSVMFGSTPAPIYALAAAEGQINVQVPVELNSSGSINVTVQTAGGTSATYPMTLAAASPGIFSYYDPLVTTRRNAVAVVANTAWIAMPASMASEMGLPSNCSSLTAATLCGEPAHVNDYLVIYVTGLGKATVNGNPGGAQLGTGQIPPASGNPIYETVDTPTVTIGGLSAYISFSGLAPGFPGLYQINTQIPAGVQPGSDVPIQVTQDGQTDSATIAVQ